MEGGEPMGKKNMRAIAAFLCAVLLSASASASAAAVFPDVRPGSWYEAAVTEMAAEGLLRGYPNGNFGPGDPITAAQLVTIAARCAGMEPAPAQTSHWAAGSMAAALEAGWYDWDELPPTEDFDKPISRQLAVKILMKALLPGTGYDHNVESRKMGDFSALSGRYYEAVLSAYAAGVVTGDGEGNFRPLDGLTRAEACILFQRALARRQIETPTLPGPEEPPPETPAMENMPPQPMAAVSGGVSENGWLQVVGTQLCNERGEAVVLRGMSSHGLQWYGQYANAQSIANTAAYGANVFRVAMYTAENGYTSQPEAMKQKAFAAVDAAISNDMYALLDWHILFDGNPMSHVEEAEAFFAEAAQRYANSPNVLYEICNEPNGNVSWAGDVKPYAERMVKTIRAHSPKAIIIIGSPNWSQDVHIAAKDPVEGENLMYTLHFYAGTHGQWLRDRLTAAMEQGLPVFITEWGTSRADGNGGVFPEESGEWLDFLAERKISWCNWSLCDKNETSAALKPGTPADRPWTEEDLSQSGEIAFSRFRK